MTWLQIERQELPHAASISFERHAADTFRIALAFSIKGGGLVYGSADDKCKVFMEAIFEPQQVLTLQAQVTLL